MNKDCLLPPFVFEWKQYTSKIATSAGLMVTDRNPLVFENCMNQVVPPLQDFFPISRKGVIVGTLILEDACERRFLHQRPASAALVFAVYPIYRYNGDNFSS